MKGRIGFPVVPCCFPENSLIIRCAYLAPGHAFTSTRGRTFPGIEGSAGAPCATLLPTGVRVRRTRGGDGHADRRSSGSRLSGNRLDIKRPRCAGRQGERWGRGDIPFGGAAVWIR